MPARLEAMIAGVPRRAGQMLARVLGGLRYGTSALTKRRPGRGAPIAPDASETLEDALPESYGDSRVVALVIDPHHLHVYWELTAQDQLDAKERLGPARGEQALTWVLRFYDVTGVELDGSTLHDHFDVVVDPLAKNWYVELWSANKAYFVELGPRAEGFFVPVCRSRPIRVPPAEPCLPQTANRPAAPELAPESPATEYSGGDAQRLCEPLAAPAQQLEVAAESPVFHAAPPTPAKLPSARIVTLGEAPREDRPSVSIAPEQSLRPSRSVSLASTSSSGRTSAWQPPK